MSGLCVFCNIREKLTSKQRNRLYSELLKYPFVLEKLENSDELSMSVIGSVKVNNRKFDLRDGFDITFNDSDFYLNFPEFKNNYFLQSNKIKHQENISVFTMGDNINTSKFMILLLSDILSIFDSEVVLSYAHDEEKNDLLEHSKKITLFSGDDIYLITKEKIQEIKNINDNVYYE